jgi:anti-sigma regulatory factor (Ser/Thr protein kinase)/ribosomal protein S18 acetylase RimI-like enzyme
MLKGVRPAYLTVPNDLSYLHGIQDFAAECARLAGFASSEIQMTLLALEEAVVNVVKHSFEPDEIASYQLIFEPTTSGIRIIIKDKGLPFAPNMVPEYIAPADIDDATGSGLGSFLMKKSVDGIEFHNLGREGKELHLIKHLPYKNIAEYHDSADLAFFPGLKTEHAAPEEKKAFTIRLMEPSESFEVSRLFYRAYGYSYGIDSIYYPDRFEQLHRDGSIISVVTVDEDGAIAGHFALVKDSPDSLIAEAAMAVVQPTFRGQGCQNAMMTRLLEEARARGLAGVFSKAVTNHVYAQKAGEKGGFKRVAIVAGLIPADRSFKGIQSELSQRESVAYGYFVIANPPDTVVYPPRHHAAFVEGIYKDLGLERTFGPVVGTLHETEAASVLKTAVMPTYNRATVEIERYGQGILSDLKTALKGLCVRKIDQITLYLPLEDPCTGLLCAEIEAMGFFIAGVLPFSHHGDVLMLQYLNNVPIDYSKIQVASAAGKDILEYVRAHDPNTPR